MSRELTTDETDQQSLRRRAILGAIAVGAGIGVVDGVSAGEDDGDDDNETGADDDQEVADGETETGDDAASSFAAALSGFQAGVESPATGCAHFAGDDDDGDDDADDDGVGDDDDDGLTWHLVLEDIEEVTQAHVHEGGRDEDGPVVAPMFAYTDQLDGSGEGETQSATPDEPLIEAGRIQDQDVIADIRANPSQYYVNVHTTANPDGEIRGQIRELPAVPTETGADGGTDDAPTEDDDDVGDDDDDGDDADDDTAAPGNATDEDDDTVY